MRHLTAAATGLALLLGGWSAACGDNTATDPCLGVQCINSPPPSCEGPTKVSYSAVGACLAVDGEPKCSYAELPRQNCESLDKLCQSGACVDPPVIPCEGVVCNSPPAPDCNENTAQIYASSGTCNPNIPPGGKCEYPVEASLVCSDGRECRNGGCIDPSEFPCDPNPCDVPPAATCSAGGQPAGWATPGTCTEVGGEASCAYETAPLLACTGGMTCVVGTCTTATGAPAAAGDLVISEIMRNPSGGDDLGEWIELYNPQNVARKLDGCVLSDLGGDSYALPAGGDGLTVGAKAYLVLGRSADAAVNGGFVPDHVYTGFVLANGDDEVILTCGETVIDRVVYADTGWPSSASHAMSLSGAKLDANQNDTAASWCDAASTYGSGSDYGTPRRPNPTCP
ncbi:MAG: lamin tail domain-containing protein [Deltaproteobacteria bacterium]|nr:MAG: lamin tail domain-containing protein [Deltaproteobacteria bacterium]